MKEGTRNFLVGLASIIALLGLAGLLMSFGELDPLLRDRNRITIFVNNGGGLRAGSSIEFHGVPVGNVDAVTITDDPKYPVRIDASLEKREVIPADVQPFVSLPLIGSTAVLQLRSPTNGADPTVPKIVNGDKFYGEIRGGMFAELTEQLDQRMLPLMESLERFNKLSDTFVSLGENLNSLLIPQSPDQLNDGEPPNLRTAIVRLNKVLEDAERGLELANSFLGDEEMRTDARQAVAKASALIDQATTAIDSYAKLAQSLETDADEFTKRLLPVIDTLGTTLEEVRRVSKLANEGRGTVGQLLNNPDLYNSLTDAATRLDRTLIKLNALIEQMKAEGVIINF